MLKSLTYAKILYDTNCQDDSSEDSGLLVICISSQSPRQLQLNVQLSPSSTTKLSINEQVSQMPDHDVVCGFVNGLKCRLLPHPSCLPIRVTHIQGRMFGSILILNVVLSGVIICRSE